MDAAHLARVAEATSGHPSGVVGMSDGAYKRDRKRVIEKQTGARGAGEAVGVRDLNACWWLRLLRAALRCQHVEYLRPGAGGSQRVGVYTGQGRSAAMMIAAACHTLLQPPSRPWLARASK